MCLRDPRSDPPRPPQESVLPSQTTSTRRREAERRDGRAQRPRPMRWARSDVVQPDDVPAAPASAPAAPAPPPKPAAPASRPGTVRRPGCTNSAHGAAARPRPETPRTAEEELERFEKSIAADLEEVEAREEAEADEAAAERAMREAEEQAARVDAIRRLREAASRAREQSQMRREAEAAANGAATTNVGDDADDSESDDEAFAEESLMDWRAKKL